MRRQGLMKAISPGIAVGGCLGLANSIVSRADSLSNGGFSLGDLTGWTVSAIDATGNPISPGIAVVPLGSQFAVEMSAGTFGGSPFISTLSQTFLVNPNEPRLVFGYLAPRVSADAGGGGGQFLDTLVVSIFDGTKSYPLLLEDQVGGRPDPFGLAPGSVSVGPATAPFLYELAADLTPLAGQNVTLNVDVISSADAALTVFQLGNFSTVGRLLDKSVVPELAAPAWVIGAGLVLAAYARRRR